MTPDERLESERRATESREKEMDVSLTQLQERARDGFTSLSREDQKYTFEALTIIDQNRQIIGDMVRWDPTKTNKGALFFGAVGTGKSHLCKCAINRWASERYRCKFTDIPSVLQKLKDAIDSKDTTVQFQVDKFITYDLLVLDDLGTEKSTEWAYEKLFSIFDTRMRLGKHTFFTTNLTLKEMQTQYGPRIVDRIRSNCRVFPMMGKSFRMMMNNNDEW